MSRWKPPFNSRLRSLDSFGLRNIVCADCGQCHPLSANEPKPEYCSSCGKKLDPLGRLTERMNEQTRNIGL